MTALTVFDTSNNVVSIFRLPFQKLGYQQITSLASATTLTVPSGATAALIQAEGANVRWRDDGTDPTPTVGMLMGQGGSPLLLQSDGLAVIAFIQVSAGAILNVSYYK